jgi:hypothetical protein
LAQTISFAPLPNKMLGDPAFAVDATASSGLDVTFSSDTPVVCAVSGNTITLVSSETCTIVASQAGNGTYNASASVSRSFPGLGGSIVYIQTLCTVHQTLADLNDLAFLSSRCKTPGRSNPRQLFNLPFLRYSEDGQTHCPFP